MSPRRDRVPMAVLRAGTWMVSCDVQPHQQKGGRRQQEINHRKQQDDSGEQTDVIWHPQPFFPLQSKVFWWHSQQYPPPPITDTIGIWSDAISNCSHEVCSRQNDRFGPLATGPNQWQVRPCPLCRRRGLDKGAGSPARSMGEHSAETKPQRPDLACMWHGRDWSQSGAARLCAFGLHPLMGAFRPMHD